MSARQDLQPREEERFCLSDVEEKISVRELLRRNHQAIDQSITRITELRAKLETEEATLSLCLLEERQLLSEMAESGAEPALLDKKRQK